MVVASAEGACMSAATMIFLSADRYEISEHSLFMFHNYSGGTFGKGGEMYDQLTKERKWSEKIIRKLYEGFLTPDEIRSILDNKDIWMDGEEVMKRLEKKVKDILAKKSPTKKKAPAKKAIKKTKS
jgi:ATP-dependent protease ClpP protease subunit